MNTKGKKICHDGYITKNKRNQLLSSYMMYPGFQAPPYTKTSIYRSAKDWIFKTSHARGCPTLFKRQRRRDGRVVRQRSAKPCTPVRFRLVPPYFPSHFLVPYTVILGLFSYKIAFVPLFSSRSIFLSQTGIDRRAVFCFHYVPRDRCSLIAQR